MTSELDSTWQDTAAAARQDWQKAQKPVMTVSIPAKIQTKHLTNTSPNHYSSNYDRWWSKKVQYKGQIICHNIQCLMPLT